MKIVPFDISKHYEYKDYNISGVKGRSLVGDEIYYKLMAGERVVSGSYIIRQSSKTGGWYGISGEVSDNKYDAHHNQNNFYYFKEKDGDLTY